jgi:hypothetical protein
MRTVMVAPTLPTDAVHVPLVRAVHKPVLSYSGSVDVGTCCTTTDCTPGSFQASLDGVNVTSCATFQFVGVNVTADGDDTPRDAVSHTPFAPQSLSSRQLRV